MLKLQCQLASAIEVLMCILLDLQDCLCALAASSLVAMVCIVGGWSCLVRWEGQDIADWQELMDASAQVLPFDIASPLVTAYCSG